MGTVYTQAFFHINIPIFNYKKIRNFFWIICVLCIALCAYLSFKTIDAFGQIGEAEERLYVFQEFEMMLTFFLNLGFILLITIVNLTSIASKKTRWVLYAVIFLIYSGFSVMDNFFLAYAMFQFKKLNQLWKGEFNLSYVKGYFTLFVCLALCVFNALMMRWAINKKQ
jgi:hypothetical protein